jgi:energy-coupling factor transporter ATP-binding protein EcfA2
MAELYQRPVARIRNADRNVIGAGFIAPQGVIITCAHVVNEALNRNKVESTRPDPGASVLIDLPWADDRNREYTGTIIEWRPPEQSPTGSNPCVDIAVLSVTPPAPEDFAVRPQSPAAIPEKIVFQVMGFPEGAPNGAPYKGEVRGTDARGWHHVEADRAFGRTLEHGFSGAPAIGYRGRLFGIVDLVNPEQRRGVLIPVEALMRAWPPLAEPYRGLEEFREEDAAYFFGRESFVHRLQQSVERHAVTLLIGPSGSGKSSLINAGLLPKFRSEGLQIIRIRPGIRPVEELVRGFVILFKPDGNLFELQKEIEQYRDELVANPARLIGYAKLFQQTRRCGLCLIVDQFEETFTLACAENIEEHKALLEALAHVGCQGETPAIKAVLGMRSDFQTLLQADGAAAGLLKAVDGEPTILLRPLDAGERQRVIQGPLDRLDVNLEDGLLGRLIEDAITPDALPLLEFVLAALWKHLRVDDGQRRHLSHAAYDEMGGLSGAVAKYADQVIASLKLDLNRAKRLFIELVRVADTGEKDARRPRSKGYLDTIDESRSLWAVAQQLAG